MSRSHQGGATIGREGREWRGALPGAAFLLVAWGRISQWGAIPKGQLLAWGRKPWLGVQLRSWLRNP